MPLTEIVALEMAALRVVISRLLNVCSVLRNMTCRVQELCEGRGDRFALPVANSPYSGLCGRKATFEEEEEEEEEEDWRRSRRRRRRPETQ